MPDQARVYGHLSDGRFNLLDKLKEGSESDDPFWTKKNMWHLFVF